MTAILGEFASPGGDLVNGTLSFTLKMLDASVETTIPRVITPKYKKVFTLTNGVIAGPGDAPYEVYGLDVLGPEGLYYSITIVDSYGEVIYHLDTNGIVGASVNLGDVSPAPPGGIVAQLGGDCQGPPGNNIVKKIQQQPVTTDDPAEGDFLVWIGPLYGQSSQNDTAVLIGPGTGGDGQIVIDPGNGSSIYGNSPDGDTRFRQVVTNGNGVMEVQGPSGELVQGTVQPGLAYLDIRDATVPTKRVLLHTTNGVSFEAVSVVGKATAGGSTTYELDAVTGVIETPTDFRGNLASTDNIAGGIDHVAASANFSFAPSVETYIFRGGVVAGWNFNSAVPWSTISGRAVKLKLYNRTGQVMTIVNDSGLAPVGEAVKTPSGADVTIADGGYAMLEYDLDADAGLGRCWLLLDWRT